MQATCNDPTPCAECVNGIDCKLRKINPSQGLPDLTRTVKAIEEHDAYKAEFCDAVDRNDSTDDLGKMVEKLEVLAKAVGHAYGLDTADRNDMDTCEGCVRPGPAVPGPGCEISFVRRMVAQWFQSTHKKCDINIMNIIITTISAKGKRKPVERNDGSPRTFPNREAARQYIRNHKYELTEPQIESSKAGE